ncbi:heterokaryon incompatibility protein-domain-containing protein [Plectosphaerella plurivora]|uniref:Heterokaryon incompatibility protein-domain-containing protein n=1 Tax=Plectosphaerella plurivora TaxID=936078 RepID=A0A9P8VKJ9_9PEZI|nr:heterokaryon incompatibility protein-domain-containing protein [Plectosphaerella plurivora]
MSESFQYQPLSSEEHEIRLFKLHPDQNPDSIISGTLRHVKLATKPAYCALSYTWGAPYDGLPPEWDDHSGTRPILVNGHEFPIRLNLHAALAHMRKLPPTPFWIDAICIDQSNVEERNQQVQIMGLIYTNVVFTLIWLGPAAAGEGAMSKMSKAISILLRSQPALIHVDGKDRSLLETIEAYKRIAQHDLGHEDALYCLIEFNRMLRCNWFQRMWIVQEAVLSRKLILTWADGAGILNWNDMRVAFDVLSRHAFHICFDGTIVEIANLAEISDALADFLIATGSIHRINSLRSYRIEGTEMALPALLHRTTICRASDPRDYIYGVIAMTPDPGLVSVNYDLSLNEVFIQASRSLLEKNKDLAVFSLRGFSQSIDLPSWSMLPRTTTIVNMTNVPSPLGATLYPGRPPVYAAGGNATPDLHFLDNDTLSISMIRLDTLRHVAGDSGMSRLVKMGGPKASRNYTFGADYKAQVRDMLETDMGVELSHLETYWRTGEPFWRAFARTLHADVSVPVGSSTGAARLPADFEPTEETLRAFFRDSTWWTTLRRRAFSLTHAKSLFCVVPDDAMPGDVVAVAIGAETPYILRPVGEDTYRFIGCAYVHEFMDGRALDLAEELGPDYEAMTFKIV